MEAHEMEERRQAAYDREMALRPECEDCGRPIATEWCILLDSGGYLCWNCVCCRRRDTLEEFSPEEPEKE